jgi:hypothetical protein
MLKTIDQSEKNKFSEGKFLSPLPTFKNRNMNKTKFYDWIAKVENNRDQSEK